ncbi:MarC family protein [Bacterioplanoides sp. SCSIO 12839]|uniref:MarC family protein n=1 Tax=Bacterioplanoides sp. SCSIO 12839 TaxID=2829569 RepID=UPI002105AA11|nr:MarC family protein [Bacterioplanoides sp. SCSIO 12839]UTW47942.1 MarC family protein [Bacterioplanoides sp. SCSIO 12839]
MIDIAATFITFFAVVDPIGTVPVFLAVTRQFDEKAQRRIALMATLTAAAVLLFFVVAGELILNAMSIPLSAFQISGGIVLFLFALTMIFGESKPDEELRLLNNQRETAIFPLAVPSIASPGAMLAAVLLTEDSLYTLTEQALTFVVLLSVLIVTYLLMLMSGKINKVIGLSGASVVSRIMGVILAAVAITNVLEGITSYFNLNVTP